MGLCLVQSELVTAGRRANHHIEVCSGEFTYLETEDEQIEEQVECGCSGCEVPSGKALIGMIASVWDVFEQREVCIFVSFS